MLAEVEQRWRGRLVADARPLTLSLLGTQVAVHAGDGVVREILDVLPRAAVEPFTAPHSRPTALR